MQKKNKTLFVLASVILASSLFGCNTGNGGISSSDTSSESQSSVTSTHTHEYGQWTITTEPTMTTAGTATRTCIDSDDTESVSVPALSDTTVWSVKSSTPDTCETAGNTVYTSQYGDVTVNGEALNHAYGAWTLVTEPTLENEGSAKRVCANDATHVETEDVPALTNTETWTVKSTTPATCEEDGNTVYTSSKYGDVTITLTAKKHAYGEWDIITAPTAEQKGSAKQICSNDQSHENIVDIPVLTDTTVWTVKSTTPATCEEDGNTVYTSVYGEVTVTHNHSGHNYGAWEVVNTPTMTSEGSVKHVCSNDANHVETKVLKNLLDTTFWSLDETFTPVMPTLTETGTARLKCEYVTIEVEIPVLTNTTFWTKSTVTTPGCTTGGQDKYVGFFGAVVTVNTDPTGHVNLTHVPGQAATCEEDGVIEHWYCPDCGHYYSDASAVNEITQEDTIDHQTGHLYGAWGLDIEPTLTEPGLASRVCEHDEDHFEEEDVPVLTDTTVWTVSNKVDPTVDASGSATYSSTYGEVTIEIPALSDTTVWTVESSTDAECEVDGKTIYTSSLYGTVEVVHTQTGHTYGEWEITTNPTETEAGVLSKVCENNEEHVETQPVAKLTDTTVWTVVENVAATEYNPGYKLYRSEYGDVRVDYPASYGRWELPEEVALGQTVTLTKTSADGTDTKTIDAVMPSTVVTSSEVLLGTNGNYTLENTGSYDFAYDATNKTYTSTNAEIDSSKSILEFTATVDGVLTFDVYCSSEADSRWDYFSCASGTCGGTSTNQNKSFTIEVTAGTTYTLTYQKDGSGKGGEDKAVISNMKFTYESTELTEGTEFVIIEKVSMSDEIVSPSIVVKGDACELPTIYKDGYKFAGWYSDLDYTKEYTNESTYNEYTVLYAKWNEAYKVTVNYNNDSENDVIIVEKGNEAAIENPTRDGFKFGGWYTTSTFDEGTEWDPSVNTTSDYSVYAKWEEAPVYTGSYGGYNIYGKSNISTVASIEIDAEGNISGQFTGTVVSYDQQTGTIIWNKSGSTNEYKMWYVDGVLVTPYSSGTTMGADLYALIKNSNGVKEDVAYSSLSSDNKTKLIKMVNTDNEEIIFLLQNDTIYTDITLSSMKDGLTISNASTHGDIVIKDSQGNTILAKGYDGTSLVDLDAVYGAYTNGETTVKFDGLGNYYCGEVTGTYVIAEEGSGYDVEVTVISNGVATEYLEYTLSESTYTVNKPMVTITYVTGEGHNVIDPVSVNKNIILNIPEVSEENWVFNGWFFDADFTEAVPEDYAPTESVSLYAKFSMPATLTVVYNNGTENGEFVYSVGDVAGIENPSYAGYVFKGWYTTSTFDEGTEWVATNTVDSDLTVYAKWEEAPFFCGTNYGFALEGTTTNGSISSFGRTATVTIDETFNGTGTSWPLSGTFTVENINEETGYLEIVKGSTTYPAYYDATNKVIVMSFSSNFKTVYIISANETSSISTSQVSSSYWNSGYTRVLTYTDSNKVVHNIFVDNGVVYFDVTISDGFGNVVVAADAYKANAVVISQGENVVAMYAHNGTTLVEKEARDELVGTYANETYGTIKIDGLGNIVVGEETGTYTIVTEGTHTIDVYTNGSFYEITLGAENTCEVNKPMVTVNYVVGEQGTVENTSASVNKNIAITLPTVTITNPLYEFKGWFFDADFTEAVPEGYAPTEEVTLYANVAQLAEGQAMGVASEIVLANNEYSISDATTDQDHLDYYFKLVVEEKDYYYIKFTSKSISGTTGGASTSTSYARFTILDSTGTQINDTKYSLDDTYNSNKIELDIGTYYIKVNMGGYYDDSEKTCWGKFSMSVAKSDTDTVNDAVTLEIGGSVTTNQIERTSTIIKFNVEEGKTYSLTGAKSPYIYIDESLTTKLDGVSIYWPESTKSFEATFTGTIYIVSMYTGVTFSVSEVV